MALNGKKSEDKESMINSLFKTNKKLAQSASKDNIADEPDESQRYIQNIRSLENRNRSPQLTVNLPLDEKQYHSSPKNRGNEQFLSVSQADNYRQKATPDNINRELFTSDKEPKSQQRQAPDQGKEQQQQLQP